MNHAAISYDDILRLKHLRNVGEFVTGMASSGLLRKPASAQCEQLVSLIYLMTEQLDGVVQRCRDDLMNMEVVQ